MTSMFEGCTSLTFVNLSGFDTSHVSRMNKMFNSCRMLRSLDLSGFDTGNVFNMYGMFASCRALESLDLSSFDTSRVLLMDYMFNLCDSLETLDLSSFETARTCSIGYMFYMSGNICALKTIYVSEKWNRDNIGNSGEMFRNCFMLKGGNNTAFNTAYTDKRCACIDRDGKPGYLTAKCSLNIADTQHGTVTADKTGTVVQGETATLNVMPDEGYAVTGVTVNGEPLAPVNGVYSFEMPDESVTVNAEFGFSDGVGARLAGHSISLDGDIGVNFYMELAPEIAASETAYMLFTIPNGDKTETKTINVKDITPKDGYYIFKCNVAAKEMTSATKAQLIDGDNIGTEYTYSVKEYADYLLENAKEDGTPEQQEYFRAAPLVEAMLTYGDYAKEYFDESDTLDDLDDVNIGSKFAEFASTLPDNLYDGTTLSLKSETTLSLYFTSSEDLEFSCADYTVEKETSGKYQIARIRGIKANQLNSSLNLTLTAGKSSGHVIYSPMNYCYNALDGGTTNRRLQNTVKALYAYFQAAKAYF